MSIKGPNLKDLFDEADGPEELATGEYAIPDELTDIDSSKALGNFFNEIDRKAEIGKLLLMGRLALTNRNIETAKNKFMEAAKMGSEEGRFFVGWLNVNTLVRVKGVEMSENAREKMFENLSLMVGAIWQYQKPELIFKLYETLEFVLSYDCLEVYSAEKGEKSWNRMLELMQRCMEEANADSFSRLLAFMRDYCSTGEFAEAEMRWIDK